MTIIPFTPSLTTSPAWSTNMMLDGVIYVASSYWNLYAQRWYLQLESPQGQVVWFGAMISSTSSFSVPLAYNVTSSLLTYNAVNSNFVITP